MDCLIHLVALCLLDPANVYVTAELYAPQPFLRSEGRYCIHQDRYCRGPVGEVRIGVTADLPKGWTLNYGVKHVSFVFENDGGDNGPFLGFTWRPLK